MAEQGEEKKLSKKELNKLARKAGKKGDKSAVGGNASSTPSGPYYTVVISRGIAPEVPSPDLTRAVDLLAGQGLTIKYVLNKTSSHLPCLVFSEGEGKGGHGNGSISGDENIARFLLRTQGGSLYADRTAWESAQIDQWLAIYASFCNASSSNPNTSLPQLLTLIDSHVSQRTYLVGETLSVADIAIAIMMKKLGFSPAPFSAKEPLSAEAMKMPNVFRWFYLCSSKIPAEYTSIPITFIPNVLPAAKKEDNVNSANNEVKKNKDNNDSNKGKGKNKDVDASADDGGALPPLEGAVEGQVVTRFPPEPSGYLHIGHCKAALLNQFYAQKYKGKLIVRFDDTNPSKEKEEFEDNIIKDLATLKIKPDIVSHSSDHFKVLEEYARKLIKAGLGYMDNTDQATMQEERMAKKNSVHRDVDVKTNLDIFEKLVKGEKDFQNYCLRAKIDMQSLNGTMRDPVLYRFNDTPHHRTGSSFKAYPTYDFACPIIDAIEGVTTALRTTEYNDRDEQYHWIQKTLGLRHVYILSFGKINFINTVLSKRKLTWFVDNNIVDGWFDPRFPTVQGCIRRGMNVDCLKAFILKQGASKRVITMEWDKFWSENKKVLEDFAPRYMAVTTEDKVEITLENVSDEVSVHTIQIHPQKPELGFRAQRRYKKILVDQIDAVTYKEGEEVTIVRWGNVKISKIEKDATSGKVTSITATYDPNATNFSKTKKASWVANVPELVPCVCHEFGHLITKSKLEDDEKFTDFVNYDNEKSFTALADPMLKTVEAGDVIQLERKGFFRCDKPYGGSPAKPIVLFFIPDGRVAKK